MSDNDLAATIAELSRPRSCASCGRLMADAAAYTIHADRGRCLPDGAHGQLVQVDGVWFRRGTEPLSQ